jgi:hypothetical protein
MLLSAETRLGLRMTAKSFMELVRYIFTIPGVKAFLSERRSMPRSPGKVLWLPAPERGDE